MTEERTGTVGIVGAGQLARMGWQAAISLDLKLLCLGAADDAAGGAGAPVLEGSGCDAAALEALAERCAVLTFEHELVDLVALAELEARGVRVRPSTAVLRLAVDKLHQRETLSEMDGVDVPAYARVSDGDAPLALIGSARLPPNTAGHSCSRPAAAATTGAACGCVPTPTQLRWPSRKAAAPDSSSTSKRR